MNTNDVPLIFDDPRTILSIWYPGEDAGGYSIIPKHDGSTSKIVAYGENGHMAAVAFYAVYDHAGNIKARVPAGLVTVIYQPEPVTASPTGEAE